MSNTGGERDAAIPTKHRASRSWPSAGDNAIALSPTTTTTAPTMPSLNAPAFPSTTALSGSTMPSLKAPALPTITPHLPSPMSPPVAAPPPVAADAARLQYDIIDLTLSPTPPSSSPDSAVPPESQSLPNIDTTVINIIDLENHHSPQLPTTPFKHGRTSSDELQILEEALVRHRQYSANPLTFPTSPLLLPHQPPPNETGAPSGTTQIQSQWEGQPSSLLDGRFTGRRVFASTEGAGGILFHARGPLAAGAPPAAAHITNITFSDMVLREEYARYANDLPGFYDQITRDATI